MLKSFHRTGFFLNFILGICMDRTSGNTGETDLANKEKSDSLCAGESASRP